MVIIWKLINMTTILDLLSKRNDNEYLINQAKREQSHLKDQIAGYERNLREVHKALMEPVLKAIKDSKRC